jgi:hypothetical protein
MSDHEELELQLAIAQSLASRLTSAGIASEGSNKCEPIVITDDEDADRQQFPKGGYSCSARSHAVRISASSVAALAG